MISDNVVPRSVFKKRAVYTIVLLSIFVLHGCASIKVDAPVQPDINKSSVFDLPYDTVWIKVVDWFADHNVTIDKIEKASGLITAKYVFAVNDNFLDCGVIKAQGTLDEPNIDKVGTLNVTIRDIGASQTKVNVNFFGKFILEAHDAWDGRPVKADGHCVTTGVLEESVINYIKL